MIKYSYLKLSKLKKIRYLKHDKKNSPYIVFLHGFMSDLEGKKPQQFLKFAIKKKYGFLALEYSGHGKSSGKFTNGNISKWSKETELLIDIIIDMKLNPKHILELGTGSGAISIALMKSFPEAKCIATDINLNSLELAKQNARKNHVLNKINFICCNWLDIFVNFDFDIILANPPYIKTEVIKKLEPEVRCYDPIISLDGGKNGVDCYKKIILGLDQKLFSKNSKILFEIGHDQAQKVEKLMKEANIMKTKVFKDYSNQPRFVLGTITKSTI